MSRMTSKAKAIAAAFGVLVVGTAAIPAQAGSFGGSSVSFSFGGHGVRQVTDDYGHSYGYRPAYNRFHHDDVQARPSRKRVVVQRFVDDDEEECRVIVKKRFNRFGDLVVKRIRVCS